MASKHRTLCGKSVKPSVIMWLMKCYFRSIINSKQQLTLLFHKVHDFLFTLVDGEKMQYDSQWLQYTTDLAAKIPQSALVFAHTLMAKIGLLQLTVTWYKIRHAGEQAYYYSRTGTAKQCYFILSNLNFLCFGCPSAGIIISLLSSMADFVPCDR